MTMASRSASTIAASPASPVPPSVPLPLGLSALPAVPRGRVALGSSRPALGAAQRLTPRSTRSRVQLSRDRIDLVLLMHCKGRTVLALFERGDSKEKTNQG